ncbi:hypothetical protein NQ314_003948 [Rhamnusium bicolor]|uniref:DUF5641 domain-containing protein n=1 Tax=Rhamnusium bicolor TaxID=1586634 RepID=A0AAV8ZKG5_9CUCU|nr:hypothetical protein NQ314_003948 [Rhamnusium bicolor]
MCKSFDRATQIKHSKFKAANALSNDPSDLSCLTPAHFLIGEPMMSYPERDMSAVPENRLSMWEKCTKMHQHFWKRWSSTILTGYRIVLSGPNPIQT